jgi:hypothetical protein
VLVYSGLRRISLGKLFTILGIVSQNTSVKTAKISKLAVLIDTSLVCPVPEKMISVTVRNFDLWTYGITAVISIAIAVPAYDKPLLYSKSIVKTTAQHRYP